jgi:uncharacterized MnhB-related membrane protein
MGNIIIGKRIPIGAAVNGAIIFLAHLYNLHNPDQALSVAAVGGLSTAVVAATQVLVVNVFGVTHADDSQG